MRTPVTVGVVGPTARASIFVRALAELPQARPRWLCDESSLRRRLDGDGPVRRTNQVDELIRDEDVDALVFVSPGPRTRSWARTALEADKHVYIDGPLATSSVEAGGLVAAAERRERCLLAQSPSLFREATQRLHGLVDRGVLGEVFYLHADRFVPRAESDGELLWGVGAETVSLVLELLGDEPIEVRGCEAAYAGLGGAEVVFAGLQFATGIFAHLHLSCLHGELADRVTVVGSEMTAVLDLAARPGTLVLYPSGASVRSVGDVPVEAGSNIALAVPTGDAIASACARFVKAVRSNGEARYGRDAASVVAVLERIARSCHADGEPETSEREPGRPAAAGVIQLR